MKKDQQKKIWYFSQLHTCFRALANPVRLKIFLSILEEACECNMDDTEQLQGNCVTSLAEKLQLGQPTVSNHVKELIAAGLVYPEKRERTIYLFGAPGAAEQFQNFGQFFVEEVEGHSHT